MKRILCSVSGVLLSLLSFAQGDSARMAGADTLQQTHPLRTKIPTVRVYHLKAAADIPLFAIGAGWSGYAFTQIYNKKHSTEEEILGLNKRNINAFDRWAVRPFSKSLDRTSYYPFFASMPLPVAFLFGDTRKDFFKLTFMYLEAMSVTGFLYTGSVYLFDRYRPYVYSDQTTMEQRTRGGAKNSFFAGHVALVATSTFFMAKVYADYHPESHAKWVLYTVAGAATATTGYLRYRAGQHFPSDILLGMAQGTATGLLVPQLHKVRLLKNERLSFMPFGTGRSMGFAMTYNM
ncbi:MAG TPA: phosphatase PAP2 family protein [Chitinophagaceae bacterium]